MANGRAMIERLLIANRGEIAVRIARTARRLGAHVIAIHSEEDSGALHVRVADEAICVGPAEATLSYLDIDAVVAAARSSDADAVHPGYGFLSESPDFAAALDRAGIQFVGPPVAAIEAMGRKDRAKELMAEAGVPVVPGYGGSNQSPSFLQRKAYEIGYPVLIKAVAGGGGKGMRRVDGAAGFEAALDACVREAKNAFGDGRVLLERFVAQPRHIEFQILADAHGNVVHLGERDCSLQRRHQKILEEAPAPGMTPEVRAAVGAIACEAARAVDYRGAGTVEFIVDGSAELSPERFFFMEMNTRLQVEHPVTEAVTGLDLVEMQLRIAAGEALPISQQDVSFDGHAVEVRLYAEDPAAGFLPAAGRFASLTFPDGEGLRVDAGLETGDTASAHYDPMIAKLIAHGTDRREALDRLQDALAGTVALGPATNLAFLRRVVNDGRVREGAFDTGLLDRHVDEWTRFDPPTPADCTAALPALWGDEPALAWSPFAQRDAFQIGPARTQSFHVEVDGEPCELSIAWNGGKPNAVEGAMGTPLEAVVGEGDGVLFQVGGRSHGLGPVRPGRSDDGGGDGAVASPMHGRVVSIVVREGDRVARNDVLFTVEAMKMEHTVTAPIDGTVAQVSQVAGEQTSAGTMVVRIEPDA